MSPKFKPALAALALIGAVLTGCASEPVPEYEIAQPKELGAVLFTGGRIYTMDETQPQAEAMIVADEKILFVGDVGAAEAQFAKDHPDGKRHDLAGKILLPGFIDTHTHPGLVAMLPAEEGDVKLPTTSKEDLFAALRQYRDDNPFEPFVMLGDWDVQMFAPDGPTKEELDEIFWRPVILFDNSGHSFWLNSSALWLFGIDNETPDLAPGVSYFVRDEEGEPTGWAKEFALFPYVGDSLMPDPEVFKAGLVKFLGDLSANGVTTLWDAGNFALDDDVYAVLAELDRATALPLDYYGSFHIWDPAQLKKAKGELLRLRKEYGGKRLKFETVKIHLDGVSEIRTSAVLTPFVGEPENRGGMLFDEEQLAWLIEDLNKDAIDLHVHLVGDRGTRVFLNAVEQARAKLGGALKIELTISHLEQVKKEDIARFKELDVHANFTPHWFDGEGFGKAGKVALGPERGGFAQVANSFLQAGANITFSSDVTSGGEAYRAPPLFGAQMAVTRQDVTARAGDPVYIAEERIPLSASLAAYTINGARQMGLENSIGTLAAGKMADFMILDQNPFEMNIYNLHKIKPLAVINNGELVAGDF